MIDLTEHHDLRTGTPVWTDHATPPDSDPLPTRKVDVAIVGAGIMGAMVADALALSGRSVALVDRRPPAAGSTAASTALVMWEIDTPLTHLAETIGLDAAGTRWRRVYDAVQRLHAKVGEVTDAPPFVPTVYLAGDLLDADALEAEGAARRQFGLPSEWLAAETVAERFGIAPRPALVSDGGFLVDPVALACGLLARARANGATVSWPVDALRFDGNTVVTDGGSLTADRIVLAGGYERARAFLPPAFSLLSSYAIATAPGTAPKWREDAMIWGASDPYLYTRTDAEGRIIAGGEDEDFATPEASRDRRIEEKAGTIAAKLAALLNVPDIAVDRRWAATFGASPDGLPAIGRARNHDGLWLASGFGGNGVSFAALGAELLLAEFDGTPDALAASFDPYRFG
ncbi:FAD-binding oxidoreductase [Sphingomonas donggukensis]|uniref:FAD-binding oxidoreductase n=1 Tax=Sphingomonas donggukensis TaxID=2949093 RepID=A0ABY4TTQ7_9SPHN|nr:FAD-dependent oxidoreductase [Sphingomonas donggukensis]URW75788.1 FAD-binding oxidoreductase [Sphingomonas donggukensis]